MAHRLPILGIAWSAVNRPTYESMQPSISHREKEIRKTVRKRRKKR